MKTVNIIREVVEGISLLFTITSKVDNGDGTFTLNTKDTLWLQENFPLVINSIKYKIKTVVEDVSITISGASLPAVDTFDVYAPKYFHGTIINTKIDMAIQKRKGGSLQTTILPFIYLKERLGDTNNREGSGKMYERESDLQLFFLTYSNFKNWLTVDHYEKSIDPMCKLVKAFLVSAKKHLLVGSFHLEPDQTDYLVNFGVDTTNGSNKSIFVDQLSGVEQNIKFPFYADPC